MVPSAFYPIRLLIVRLTITRIAAGRLDLLFNVSIRPQGASLLILGSIQNAGINSPQVPIEEVSLETFQSVISVNLIGAFLCTREAVKIFKAQNPKGGQLLRT